MKKILVFTVSLFLFVQFFNFPVKASSQTITLYPSADATVIEGSSDNHGSDHDITCSTDTEQKSFFVKFDLGSIASDVQIESVSLSLSQTSASGENVAISVYPVTSTWGETSIFGTNKPGVNTGTSYGQATIDTSNGDKGIITTPQFKSGVQMWVQDPATNYGLYFNCGSSGTYVHEFGSRESISKPQLTITYSNEEVSAAPVISNIQVKNITDTEAEITWVTDKNSIGFVDYGIDTSYGGVKGSGDFITTHSVGLIGLTPDTEFHFRIRVKDEDGNEALSENQTFKTEKGEDVEEITQEDAKSNISSPRNLKAERKDDEGSIYIELRWDHSNEDTIDGYRIYRSIDNSLSYFLVTEVGADTLSYEDREVEAGKKYFYTIRTVKDGEESQDSNVAKIEIGEDGEVVEEGINFWKGFVIINIFAVPILVVLYIRYKKNRSPNKNASKKK